MEAGASQSAEPRVLEIRTFGTETAEDVVAGQAGVRIDPGLRRRLALDRLIAPAAGGRPDAKRRETPQNRAVKTMGFATALTIFGRVTGLPGRIFANSARGLLCQWRL